MARSVRLGPNAERDYREALEAVALLHGAVDEPPELVVLKGAVQQHLAKAPPAQMTSSIPTGSQQPFDRPANAVNDAVAVVDDVVATAA